MIERIITWCASNRFLVFTGTAVLTLWGFWAMTATPLDAVPDISDVQVIVSTEWTGRSPDFDRRPDHLPPRLSPHLDASGADGARLYRLRDLVRLRHLRGRDRHVLGPEPGRRVSPGHPRTAA